MNKSQWLFAVVAGIFSVWAYYNYLGGELILIPFTYFMMPIWLFTAGIHGKGIIERGEANEFLKYMYGPLAFLVLIIDVVWNITVGSIVYREIPKEFLFTTRTKRHIKGAGSRQKMARFWAQVLNAIDPNHI